MTLFFGFEQRSLVSWPRYVDSPFNWNPRKQNRFLDQNLKRKMPKSYLGSGPRRTPSSSPLPLPSRTWWSSYHHFCSGKPVKFNLTQRGVISLLLSHFQFPMGCCYSIINNRCSFDFTKNYFENKISPNPQDYCAGIQHNPDSIEVSSGPGKRSLILFPLV